MNIRQKIVVLALLITLAIIYGYIENHFNTNIIHAYNRIYYALQHFRICITSVAQFSVGDILYIIGGIGIVCGLYRCAYLLFHFKSSKIILYSIAINALNITLGSYLLFIIGWGANYNKMSLPNHWKLDEKIDTSFLLCTIDTMNIDRTNIFKNSPKRLIPLIDFNIFLLTRLNEYSSGYQNLQLNELNERAVAYYTAYTNSSICKTGLHIKPSLFGYFLEHMAIEGYYNPFTGEGQVNSGLPSFIMPFLVCHEMAHQAGIASEEDANLLAYALGVTSTDSTFRYSAYLNLWQYANNRLYRFDSGLAIKLERNLNPTTTSQLDSLDKISARYHHQMARYSSEIYDSYLKMNDQKEGVRSYANVAKSARIFEKISMFRRQKTLLIP